MNSSKIDQLKALAERAGLKPYIRTYNGGMILNITTDDQGRFIGLEVVSEGKSVRHYPFMGIHEASRPVSYAKLVEILNAKVAA